MDQCTQQFNKKLVKRSEYLKSLREYLELDQKHLGMDCDILDKMLIHYLNWPYIYFLNAKKPN